MRQTGWKRWWIYSVLALFLLVADYGLYPRCSRPSGPSGDAGANGLWVHYTWYFHAPTLRDVADLASRVRENRIRDVYVHVRYIRRDGTLRYRFPGNARTLVAALHRQAPGTRVLAWAYAGNARGLGTVDLSRPAVRCKMVGEAVWLTTICGFDGIQWDYEICPDGDRGFLALLRETRAALPRGKVLSVATPLWMPRSVGPHGWRELMFRDVAASCDQMAVMAYDSALYLPRAYAWLVARQVAHVTRAAARGNPACRVVMGVPTYARGGLSHHPYAESLRVSLIGVRDGLADRRTVRASFQGVALFADYTTQPEEWHTYRVLWTSK